MLAYALFDLDGTLSDPKEGITKSVAHALHKFNMEAASLDDLIPFIGPPLKDSFMEFYGMDEQQAELAIVYYREYFADKGIFENLPYDGITELLQTLCEQDITCIVATSKPEAFAKRILDHFQLTPYFKDVCGATMDSSRSKKGDVIAYALQKHEILPAQAVMVGDRKHDILGAKEHEVQSIGVLYGYGSMEELRAAKADYIVKDPQELLALLQAL